MRLAILDDYQRVALEMADWSPLAGAVEISVFDRPLGDEEAVARALQGFAIACVMRERTPRSGHRCSSACPICGCW
jgi:hypothetical protein